MPSQSAKSGDKQKFLKRCSFAQGKAEIDAAHIATYRLYCDAFGLWRRCRKPSCKRHRRCTGEPHACLVGGLPFVPPAEQLKVQKDMIAGGPRRVPPATHFEWQVRRCALAQLLSWRFG